jgi:anti-anti-sigma factor
MTAEPPVHLEQDGAVLIVSPRCAFGAFNDADLSAAWNSIEARLADESVRNVTIDLGTIPYFGSTVLEWLVLIWKRIRGRGGRMVICNCSEMGRQILAASRLDTLWTVCPDRTAALAMLA